MKSLNSLLRRENATSYQSDNGAPDIEQLADSLEEERTSSCRRRDVSTFENSDEAIAAKITRMAARLNRLYVI